jgi:hypothetical protein
VPRRVVKSARILLRYGGVYCSKQLQRTGVP